MSWAGSATSTPSPVAVSLGWTSVAMAYSVRYFVVHSCNNGTRSSRRAASECSPRLYVDSDTLVGTLHYGTLPVATATMGYKHRPLDPQRAHTQITAPSFMLKIMPGYDGRPRICELVRTQITDVTVKGAWTDPARLQLFEHALAPLADLPVREVISATHIVTDLSLAPATVVHDYLKEQA